MCFARDYISVTIRTSIPYKFNKIIFKTLINFL
jgi:hypothetical protein